ncbi:preprotein translocase subunit SecE [Fructobacillus sp. M2-14]|uniref:Preprotein translocase subunit SecE n=1 Tax=Fructobacillus broussonetiae TaxID=2713173 RepID=A0ABS5QZN2_9LACO|nr:preprotein translocase subunit SecE [Fructobacillus broussonetiae]MBS9338659.1 preprotein translocase subunit SecE [Fructobacillus broussonetiae]
MITYFKNVASEMKKVTWLSFDQTVKETVAVLAMSIMFGLLIGAFDWVLKQGVNFLLAH